MKTMKFETMKPVIVFLLMIIFACCFSCTVQAETRLPISTSWFSHNNARTAKMNAVWRHTKKHHKHRHIVKGNGRTMKVNRVSTCPLSKK